MTYNEGQRVQGTALFREQYPHFRDTGTVRWDEFFLDWVIDLDGDEIPPITLAPRFMDDRMWEPLVEEKTACDWL